MGPADDSFATFAPLATTLHQLDEAHRRFRAFIAVGLALSKTELAALIVIADNPGMSPGNLSQELDVTTGATTALIDRLEDSGHVQRDAHPGDRRRLALHLTSAGRSTLHEMMTSYRSTLAHAGLDGTLVRTLPQLQKITAALNHAVHVPNSVDGDSTSTQATVSPSTGTSGPRREARL